MKRYGETRRGWLGVNIQSVSEDIAQSLGVTAGRGAMISSVARGGPAEKGGLKAGDVILRFDGREVRTMRSLPRIVAQTGDGKTVNVEISRKRERLTLNVVVGRLEEKPRAARAKSAKRTESEVSGSAVLLGMTVSKLTEEMRRKFKLGKKVVGVLVQSVAKGSAAEKKEIKAGQIIVEAAQKTMQKPADLAAAIKRIQAAGRRAILLRVENAEGELRFVAIPLKGS